MPGILRLIRGLAEYERLSHQVEATAGRLRRHGFGRRRYFETLLCYRGRKLVGFALYVFTYSTFLARPTLYLEDLFVLPDERGNGAGRALLSALAAIAVRKQCGRMEWAVLDWNTPAIKFYEFARRRAAEGMDPDALDRRAAASAGAWLPLIKQPPPPTRRVHRRTPEDPVR